VWALNQSLLRKSEDYVLYVLALDKEAKDVFNCGGWRNENIEVVFVEDLIKSDKHLSKCRTNNPSYEALNIADGDAKKATWLQFVWSLSAYFTWYCMENFNTKDVLYIDADIYFFDSWKKIYDNLDNTSVGIVEHRCPYSPSNGKYNVGIVYFKNDLDGYKCCTWWKNCLLFADNQYYKTHGSCGDQKYLELFERLFDGVATLDKYFAHLAPWNYAYHEYTGCGEVIWNGQSQTMMYCHFSNFKPNYEENTYLMASRHGIEQSSNVFIKKMYDEYFDCLRRVND
jgi:hypothetical protein